jgi:AraC-like DNA-binding protein
VAPRSSTLDEYERIYNAVCEYIEEAFKDDITLETFSRDMDYSRRTVQRAMEGAHRWTTLLRNRRIFEARRLLSNFGSDRLNVNEIAKAVGYTPSYFGKVFKEETGMTPIEYRRAQRNGR